MVLPEPQPREPASNPATAGHTAQELRHIASTWAVRRGATEAQIMEAADGGRGRLTLRPTGGMFSRPKKSQAPAATWVRS